MDFKAKLLVENVQALVTPLPAKTYLMKLSDVIASARESVDIIQYQWKFMTFAKNSELQIFNQGILRQIRSGIKYRVILNANGFSPRLTRYNMDTKRHLENAGAQVKFGANRAITHAKLFIIDSQHVFLGSHNMSDSAVSVNDEVSVLISNREVANEYKRYFELLWVRR